MTRIRSQQREIGHTTENPTGGLDRWPTDIELAKQLGITLKEMQGWIENDVWASRTRLRWERSPQKHGR